MECCYDRIRIGYTYICVRTIFTYGKHHAIHSRRDLPQNEKETRCEVERNRQASHSREAREIDGPVEFAASTAELAGLIAKAGVRLDDVPLEDAIRYYEKMRTLECLNVVGRVC